MPWLTISGNLIFSACVSGEMLSRNLRISPLTHADKIKLPLMVSHGKNDPRVPYTEAEQIVKKVRANGSPVWYLLAEDEGHGFAKKANADFQFAAMTTFYDRYLLKRVH